MAHVPAMDVDDRIASTGCEETYRTLEDCIVANDRDWRKCQVEVLSFRECMQEKGRSASVKIKPETTSPAAR